MGKKLFFVNNEPVGVEEKDVQDFVKYNPNAEEGERFILDKDIIRVKKKDRDDFLKYNPNAKPTLTTNPIFTEEEYKTNLLQSNKTPEEQERQTDFALRTGGTTKIPNKPTVKELYNQEIEKRKGVKVIDFLAQNNIQPNESELTKYNPEKVLTPQEQQEWNERLNLTRQINTPKPDISMILGVNTRFQQGVEQNVLEPLADAEDIFNKSIGKHLPFYNENNKGVFRTLADKASGRISEFAQLPQTVPGDIIAGIADLPGFIVGMQMSPAVKAVGASYKGITLAPKITTYMTGKNLLESTNKNIDTEAPIGEKLTNIANAGVRGFDESMLLHFAGVGSAALGKTAGKALKSEFVDQMTNTLANGALFGGMTAGLQSMEGQFTHNQLANKLYQKDYSKLTDEEKQEVDKEISQSRRELYSSIGLGVALAAPGLGESASKLAKVLTNRASLSFENLPIELINKSVDLKVPIETLTKNEIELSDKASKEADPKKAEALQRASTISGVIRDLKVMADQMAKNPDQAIAAIEANKDLAQTYKEQLIEKIKTVKTGAEFDSQFSQIRNENSGDIVETYIKDDVNSNNPVYIIKDVDGTGVLIYNPNLVKVDPVTGVESKGGLMPIGRDLLSESKTVNYSEFKQNWIEENKIKEEEQVNPVPQPQITTIPITLGKQTQEINISSLEGKHEVDGVFRKDIAQGIVKKLNEFYNDEGIEFTLEKTDPTNKLNLERKIIGYDTENVTGGASVEQGGKTVEQAKPNTQSGSPQTEGNRVLQTPEKQVEATVGEVKQPETIVPEKTPDQINKSHNDIIDMTNEYNNISKSHTAKRKTLFDQINKLSSELGYSTQIDKNKNLVISKEGNLIRKIPNKRTPEEIESHKVLNDYDNEGFKLFANRVITNPDIIKLPGINWGIDKGRIDQAIRDIASGKKSVAANDFLDKLVDAFNNSGFEHIDGKGKNIKRTFIPLNEMFPDRNIQKELAKEREEEVNLSENDNDFWNNLAKDDFVRSEFDAEQIKEIKDYENEQSGKSRGTDEPYSVGDRVKPEGSNKENETLPRSEENKGIAEPRGTDELKVTETEKQPELTKDQQDVSDKFDQQINDKKVEFEEVVKKKAAEVEKIEKLKKEEQQKSLPFPLAGELFVKERDLSQQNIDRILEPFDNQLKRLNDEIDLLEREKETGIKEISGQKEIPLETIKTEKNEPGRETENTGQSDTRGKTVVTETSGQPAENTGRTLKNETNIVNITDPNILEVGTDIFELKDGKWFVGDKEVTDQTDIKYLNSSKKGLDDFIVEHRAKGTSEASLNTMVSYFRDGFRNYVTNMSDVAKAKEKFAAEKEKLKQAIKEDWNRASKDGVLTAVPIPYAKQLAYITPNVLKLSKLYIDSGITKISDLAKQIYSDLSDSMKWLTEKDIRNILNNQYSEKDGKITERSKGFLAGEPFNANSNISEVPPKKPPIEEINKESKEPFKKEHIGSTRKLLRKIRENLQDEMINTRKLQEKNNLKVTHETNIDWANNQKNSRATDAIKTFKEKEFKPIVNEVAKLRKYGKEFNNDKYIDLEEKLSSGKITQEEFNTKVKELDKKSISRYLIAKHAPERNESFYKEKNPDTDKPMPEETNYSGMTNKEANEIVSNFEKGIPQKDITALWNNINKANNNVLHKWVEYGKFDKIADVIKERNWKYYVPLRGWEKEYTDLEQDYTGKGKGDFAGTPIAEGRTSIADDPLAEMFNMAQSVVVWGEKNRVKQKAIELIQANKERTDLFYTKKISYLISPDKSQIEVTIDKDGNVFELTGGYDKNGNVAMNKIGSEKNLIESGYTISNKYNNKYQLRKPANLSKQHEIDAFIGGQKYKGIFTDANIANEINGAYKTDPVPYINWVSNTLGKLKTVYSVTFGARNPVRDHMSASAYTWMERGTKEALLFEKNWPIALAQTARGNLGKTSGKYMGLWSEFTKNGGITGSTSLQSLDVIKESIKKISKELQNPKVNAVKNSLKVWKVLEYTVQHLETTTRYAVYISARENGASIPEAINAAKECTVNFDRKGNVSSTIGSFVNFYNASVQGANQQIYLAKKHPVKYTATAIQLAVMGYVTAYLYNLYNSDKDKKKDYKEPNKWSRYNNIVIGTDDHRLSLPISQGYRAWNAFGNIAYDLEHGKISLEDASLDAIDAIQNALSPVEMASLLDREKEGTITKLGKMALKQISAVEPVINVLENKDYAGRAIYRQPFTLSQEKYMPNYQKYLNNTNPLLIGLAESIAKSHGVDLPNTNVDKEGKQLRDVYDINPAIWDYYIRSYGAGAGSTLMDAVTAISKKVWDKSKEYEKHTPDQVEGVDLTNIPLVNAFYRNKSKGRLDEEFKPIHKWYQNFENRFRELDKTQNPERILDEKLNKTYNKWLSIDLRMSKIDENNKLKKTTSDKSLIDYIDKENDIIINDIIDEYNK